MSWVVLLLLNSIILAAAQSPMIASEGDPFEPVPAYEGYIVQSGHFTNSSADGSGYIAAPGKIAKIDAIISPAIDNLQPNLEACSRSCVSTTGCSAYIYCQAGSGPCQVNGGIVYPERGCELVLQSESNVKMTVPFMAMQQGTSKNLISGAPILSSLVDQAGPLPGFSELFAQSFYNKYDYSCNGTLLEGSCALTGDPASLVDKCDEDPEQRCNLMVWYPEGRPDLGPNITFFKGGKDVLVDASEANLNHHGVAYVRLGQVTAAGAGGSSGGLSDGAVAGIAIGSAIGGALLATAATILALKRRRRGDVLQLKNNENDVELQMPSTVGHSTGSTVLTSSPPHSASGSTPQGSGSSAARTTGTAAAVAGPPTLKKVSVQQERVANVSPFVFYSHNTPFDFPNSSNPIDTIAATPRKPSTSGGSKELTSSQQQLQQPAEVSPFAAARAASASTSSTDYQQPSRSRRSLEIGNRLDTAASTATVLDAIKGAGWGHYAVEFDSIQWVQHPDGKLWELGHGAFSKVYKVSLDTTLALAAKVIPLEDANAERVFLRETITLFHLRHPNVVQFSGVCIHEKKGILLMELMEGGSLYENMEKRNSSGVRVTSWYLEGRRIAVAIAQALHYLHHSLQVIHMDLKSANVLLGRDYTAKLADVGFSRVWASMELSAKDSRIGTFAYMAPELLLGGTITSAADIYSFGVLLRELCTGEYPSRGRSRFPKVPEECPQEMADVIMACMKKEPEDRPTAKDVHSMLLKCP